MIWLSALLLQGTADFILLEHSRPTSYTRIRYETACRNNVIQIAYGFDPKRMPMSRIERFRIDKKEVEGALAILQLRAAGRSIDNIGIMHCDFDGPNPAIKGSMSLGYGSGATSKFPPTVYFELKREDGRWRMIDRPWNWRPAR